MCTKVFRLWPNVSFAKLPAMPNTGREFWLKDSTAMLSNSARNPRDEWEAGKCLLAGLQQQAQAQHLWWHNYFGVGYIGSCSLQLGYLPPMLKCLPLSPSMHKCSM